MKSVPHRQGEGVRVVERTERHNQIAAREVGDA